MDLLNMLSGLMTSSSSINALSEKTGADSSETKGIIDTALPMLVSALTSNASSESGASSLLGALQQHTDKSSIEEQIANADEEDGGKIIKHILGDKQSSVLQSISEKTGAQADKVGSVLSNFAPSLMSGLSAATSQASRKAAQAALKEKAKETVKKPIKEEVKETVKETEEKADAGLDLSGLLGLLGGGDAGEAEGGLGSLLGGLFGGGSDSKEDKTDGGSLLDTLTSFLK